MSSSPVNMQEEPGTKDKEVPTKTDPGQKQNLFPIFQKNFKPPPPNPLKNLQIDLADARKHSPKRLKKSLLGKRETGGLTQMVLDAGQKEVGPRICTDCGLLYSPGDAEDELEHQKAHRRLSNLHTITLWKDVNILHNFVDGGMVILVDKDTEKKTGRSRLKDFCAWVDSEVGGGNGSQADSDQNRFFLYVLPAKRKNQVRVLGCARMEIIDEKEVLVSRLDPLESVDGDRVNEDQKILVGVTRLWTDENFRRKQIASRLVDMVRFHSGIPGCIVTRNQLGILEPSEDGKAFFRKYTGGQGRVYTYNYSPGYFLQLCY